MSTSGSLARTAVVAIALTIGFYTLAIGVALGLFYAAYLQLTLSHLVIRLFLFCVIGGGMILWSIVPRFDKFIVPGPQLERSEQSALFDVIEDVARTTGQEMPAEVYIDGNVNASVMYRGGIMGIGSRRVLVVGLPLMQSVTVPQLRAILAHEFGHYHNEDLKFAGWIYKTRAAIERTVANTTRHLGLLALPLRGYATLFIRITQSISRAQEFAADRLAARVAGADEMIHALIAIRRAALAHPGYVNSELDPVFGMGFRPPLAAGFSSFMAAPAVKKQVDEELARIVAEEQTSLDDSHPPLRERVAALGDMPAEFTIGRARATSLLRDLANIETGIIVIASNHSKASQSLQPVAWEETPSRVYLPGWKKLVETHSELLRGVTAAQIPARVRGAEPQTIAALGCALAVKLFDGGWTCHTAPGSGITFRRDGRELEPFAAINRLASATLTGAQWIDECRGAGIEELPLL